MVTKEDLQEKYNDLKTVDLLEITANKPDYTPLAVSVAYEELRKRKVPEEDIRNYKSALAHTPTKNDIENYFIDLNLFQKLLCYFIILPRYRRYFHGDFGNKGYVLKSQQANYYLVVSISLLITAAILANIFNFDYLYLWFAGFMPAYLFDVFFNKERQLKNLQEIAEQGKSPWEF